MPRLIHDGEVLDAYASEDGCAYCDAPAYIRLEFFAYSQCHYCGCGVDLCKDHYQQFVADVAALDANTAFATPSVLRAGFDPDDYTVAQLQAGIAALTEALSLRDGFTDEPTTGIPIPPPDEWRYIADPVLREIVAQSDVTKLSGDQLMYAATQTVIAFAADMVDPDMPEALVEQRRQCLQRMRDMPFDARGASKQPLLDAIRDFWRA